MKEIVVALDALTREEAVALARKLQGQVWGFKVNDLLLEYGTGIITELSKYGDVFADPKLHDTPNTVFNSVTRLANAGAKIITVHTSGGADMLRHALNAAKSPDGCMIAAVTTLTSLSDETVREIYRGFPIQRFIETLKTVGVQAVVCAGRESEVYAALGFKTIVPGFRPFGPLPFDDQKRSSGLLECDYLVVGRPVVQHENPVKAIESIKERIKAY